MILLMRFYKKLRQANRSHSDDGRRVSAERAPFDVAADSPHDLHQMLSSPDRLNLTGEINLRFADMNPTLHTVRKGETIASIALEHYGSVDLAPTLVDANGASLTARPLFVGQVLRIPRLATGGPSELQAG